MAPNTGPITPFIVIRDKCGICGSIVKAEDSLTIHQRLDRARRSPDYPFATDPGEPESPNINFLANLATPTPVYPQQGRPKKEFVAAIKHDRPNPIFHDYLFPVTGWDGFPVVYYPTCNAYNAILDDTMPDSTGVELRDSIMSHAPGVLIHQQCLKLARKTMAYRKRHLPRSTVNIESEEDLSRSLTIRFSTNLFTKLDWSGFHRNGPVLYTHWENPNKYHGAADYGERTTLTGIPPGFFTRTLTPKYPPKYPASGLPLMYLADPYDSIYATPVFIDLLSNPRIMRVPRFDANDPFTRKLHALPQEIINQILDDLFHPFTNASLICNYILPSQYWYNALRSNDLIPWLWDVDFTHVEKFLEHREPGKARDWEMVARILSQDDAMELLLPRASLAIKNRQRVWRLCMEMEITESARSVEQQEALERYINRGGRFLPPLPVISEDEEKELTEGA